MSPSHRRLVASLLAVRSGVATWRTRNKRLSICLLCPNNFNQQSHANPGFPSDCFRPRPCFQSHISFSIRNDKEKPQVWSWKPRWQNVRSNLLLSATAPILCSGCCLQSRRGQMRCSHYGKKKAWNRALLWEKGWVFFKGEKCVNTHTHTGELSPPVSAVYSYSIIVLSPHFLFTGKKNVFNDATCGNIYESCRKQEH